MKRNAQAVDSMEKRKLHVALLVKLKIWYEQKSCRKYEGNHLRRQVGFVKNARETDQGQSQENNFNKKVMKY